MIAVLLVVVIALFPGAAPPGEVVGNESSEVAGDDREQSGQADDQTQALGRDGSEAEAQQTESEASEADRAPEVSEEYPVDEERPDPQATPRDAPADREHWWLPPGAGSVAERGSLVLVIDDAGNTLDAYDRFLAFPGASTVAVLPQLDYSVQAAAMASAAGKEIILHQPMEAIGGSDPGPGAIGDSLGAAEIAERVRANLASVPGAIGVNNHMGSLATSQLEVMEPLLATLHERGLFFLDSRTSAETVARFVAADVGIAFAERNVFLDNERTRDAILTAVSHALELSLSGEPVIMIGHATVPLLADILNEIYPVLIRDGYEFVPLSATTSSVHVASVREPAGDGR